MNGMQGQYTIKKDSFGLILGGIFLLQVCVSEMSSCASMYAHVCIHIYILKIIFAKTGKYALIYTMN